MKLATPLCLLLMLLANFPCRADDSERSTQALRKTFLQAEQYLKADRDSDYLALSDTLKTYVLYPYLQYQWLLKHLDDTIAITAFLHAYPDSRYAALLHGKWLAHLGSQQQWLIFIRHYMPSDNLELQCYFAQAQYQVGQQQEALAKAKQLWLSGKPQPAACERLFDWLKISAEFTPDWIWQRFENALTQNNMPLATDMQHELSESERSMAAIWLKLHQQPQLLKQPARWQKTDPRAGRLFSHAINRWLETEPLAALQAWEQQKPHFSLSKEQRDDTERRLAMQLAFKHDARAYARLSEYAGSDVTAQEWRVRAALYSQNWQDVLTAIDALNDDVKRQDKWQYWRGRALDALHRADEARPILAAIARQRSFHGFLAADRIAQPLAMNPIPLVVSVNELDALASHREFQATSEWLALERKLEATRQWWHALAGLDPRQLVIATKLAEKWQWPAIAIATIAKANQWDDLELRFPLAFAKDVLEQAQAQQLDPSLLFALIRQESAFDEFAGSSAGALGLMQLMPATVKQIAADWQQPWSNDFNLVIPAINIKFGSHYFKQILSDMDQQYVLAIAAYNAGGKRVKQWRPRDHALPADIWIETLPYKETRTYIASVVLYAFIYQQRLQRNELKMFDFMREVKPR